MARLDERRLGPGVWALAVAVAAAGLTGVLCMGPAVPVHADTFDALQQVAARDTPRTKARARKRPAKAAEQAGAEKGAKVLSRKEVLAADPAALARVGRHLVIGYELPSTVTALVEKRAIAGIFITDHNVRRKKAANVKAEIDALQATRAAQGLPPLIVAADQEGGSVSRLTPPLKRQASLADVIGRVAPGGDVKAAVEAYAKVQAEELKSIGVNLNFAPVVDLKIDPKRRSDGQTRLRERALSDDPKRVAEVAGWYCDTLAAAGVMCTIKHFPGLGRVKLDTHRTAGEIGAPTLELKGADWVPFRELMGRRHVVTMLAHVRVSEIDKAAPASYSEPVITGLMRTDWRHDGLLITDDFSMGAITRAKEGVGGAAVKSLNAGADLVLVSFSDKHLNAVMTSLLEADAKGLLDSDAREASLKRLSGVTFGAMAGPGAAASGP